MKKIFVLILISGLFFTSCEKFLDVNESQDTPETTSPNYLLPTILGNMAYTTFEQGTMTAYFTQQVTGKYGTSSYTDRWDFRNAYRIGLWRKNYYDVAGNASKMILFAEKEGSQNYVGVGKIMMAFSFLTATDLFGDMPILEAFTGTYNPHYDEQAVVYTEINKWLDEGIVALEASSITDRKLDAAADRMFEGDINAWISFAHAIKARYYLHLGDYPKVLTEVALAKANWKEPIYLFDAEAENAWGKNPWGPSKARPQWDMVVNSLDASVTTDFMMEKLTMDDDSVRLHALTTAGKNNMYSHVPASEGIGALKIDDFANLWDGFWTADGSPMIFVTSEELNFMEAEAAFHEGDASAAYDAYIRGIKVNFSKLGLNDNVDAYLGNANIVANNSAALEISDIMVQKYIAMYLQPEAWSDLRRWNYSETAYPNLKYPANAMSELNGAWIQRLPYDPQTEYIYNPKEIERLGAKAEDWVGKKIWWVENSTLGK